jgi:hypothetical protein
LGPGEATRRAGGSAGPEARSRRAVITSMSTSIRVLPPRQQSASKPNLLRLMAGASNSSDQTNFHASADAGALHV